MEPNYTHTVKRSGGDDIHVRGWVDSEWLTMEVSQMNIDPWGRVDSESTIGEAAYDITGGGDAGQMFAEFIVETDLEEMSDNYWEQQAERYYSSAVESGPSESRKSEINRDCGRRIY